MTVPSAKNEMIKATEKEVVNIERQYKRGFITDDERYRLVVSEWEKDHQGRHRRAEQRARRVQPHLHDGKLRRLRPMNQIRQLAGMRGLMANTAGKTIEIPIKSNFREGLSVLEYFISTRGARKGMADTALRTADSGYLTRRMVDVCQDVIIREADCGTTEGVWASAVYDRGQMVETFGTASTAVSPQSPSPIPRPARCCLTPTTCSCLRTLMFSRRTASTRCSSVPCLPARQQSGVCAKCYGINLAIGRPVNMGEAVGVIAAQSIGEPGTQLTMRTFHTGGVAGDDITQGLPRVEELFEARKPKKMATLSEISGTVTIEEAKKGVMYSITITNEAEG